MLGQQDIKIDILLEHWPGRHQSEANHRGEILQRQILRTGSMVLGLLRQFKDIKKGVERWKFMELS